jgi:acyl-homoserine lactone acylase PvdQ
MIAEMCPGDVRIYMAFPGGNDENPDGKYYNNLLEDYVYNRYFRMSFSDEEVEANKDTIVEFKPE